MGEAWENPPPAPKNWDFEVEKQMTGKRKRIKEWSYSHGPLNKNSVTISLDKLMGEYVFFKLTLNLKKILDTKTSRVAIKDR